MLCYLDHKNMGRSELGWLDSYFHFSFAEYYNPNNINFGVLRVVNDDLIAPNTGFDTHPHRDMEIMTYVVDGELTHADSMGNRHTLTRGQVQYMSAGTGITRSEHNFGKETLRLLQIWIYPDKKGYKPNYGEYRFLLNDRNDKWLHIASSTTNKTNPAHLQIHQDVNIYATIIDKNSNADFIVAKGRQAYMLLIEGKAKVSDIILKERDALEIIEEDITISALEKAHILIIEMGKE